MASIVDLKLSAEASVETEEGFMNAFQMNTFAVRVELDDGRVIVKMLEKGLAARENGDDPAFRSRVAGQILKEAG